MVRCWRCLAQTPEEKFCMNCGFRLCYEIEGIDISLALPDSDDPIEAFLDEVKNSMVKANEKLRKEVKEVEKGLKSPEIENLEVSIMREVQGSSLEIFVVYALEALRLNTGEKLNSQLAAEADFENEKIQYITSSRLSDDEISYLDGSSRGARYFNGLFLIKTLNKGFTSSFDATEFNGLILFFLRSLEHFEEEQFVATINHEMTHVFIQQNSSYSGQKKPLKAINEAAAEAVSIVSSGAHEDDYFKQLNTYRREGIPKSLLRSCVKAFEKLADEKSGRSEKISFVRQKSIEAIKKAQEEDVGIIESILRSSEDLRKRFYILRQLEITENLTSYTLFQMGFIGRERMREWTYQLDENRSVEDVDRLIEPQDVSRLKDEVEYLESLSSDIFGGLCSNLRELIRKYEKDHSRFVSNGRHDRVDQLIHRLDVKSSHYEFIGEDKNEIQEVIDDYFEYLEAAENHIKLIRKITKSLHEDEDSLASKIRSNDNLENHLAFLLQKTEELYDACDLAINRVEKARKSLEKAERELNSL